MTRLFTIVGFHPDTNETYCDSVESDSWLNAAALAKADGVAVVAVLVGTCHVADALTEVDYPED